MNSIKLTFTFIAFGFFTLSENTLLQAQATKNKTTILNGKVYRSDTNQPIPAAKIEIWSSQKNKLESKTDEQGNYYFGQVKGGKYFVKITVQYNKITDVPCNVGTGATADKNSYVNMKDEGLGYVDVWVSIDNFRVNSNKPMTKDFDVKCKGFSKKNSIH
jgi:hypothetical protein